MAARRPRASRVTAWSFRLARLARWPRPLFIVLLVAGIGVLAAGWRPLVIVAAATWGLVAAATILDARLRGRHGYIAGLLALAGGPLVAAAIALAVRRHVRKVSPRFRAAPPLALATFLAALVGLTAAGFWVENRVGFTDVVPSAAMEPRIRLGDRVVIAPIMKKAPRRGDIVAIGPFPGAVAVTGIRRVVAIARVLGLPGDWIGATADRGLYVCSSAPRITRQIVPDDVCRFPDETSYISRQTAVFGPVEVPTGTVFVLGDNRQSLDDSRTYGPVPRSALIGPVVMTVWPLSRLAVR